MDGIKMSVSGLEKYLKNTYDDVWFGILKREFWDKKMTLSEWLKTIETIKSRPAN